MKVDISVIIVNFNTRELLERCLETLSATSPGLTVETIVVDNASSDGSLEMVRRKFPEVKRIANTHNAGFAAANNQGAAHASGRRLFFLNPDTELFPDTLHHLNRFLDENPSAGAVGPKTFLDKDATLEVCTLKRLTLRRALILFTHLPLPFRKKELSAVHQLDFRLWTAQAPLPVEGIGGAAIFMDHRLFTEIGGFDTRFFMGYEDTDLAETLRRAGRPIFVEPRARIVHLFGQAKRLPEAPPADIYAWTGAPLTFIRKYYGAAGFGIMRSAKILDAIARHLPEHPLEATLDASVSASEPVTISWNDARSREYLFEISNEPLFYDKFGAVTREPRIDISGEIFLRLGLTRWYFRVFTLSHRDFRRIATGVIKLR